MHVVVCYEQEDGEYNILNVFGPFASYEAARKFENHADRKFSCYHLVERIVDNANDHDIYDTSD